MACPWASCRLATSPWSASPIRCWPRSARPARTSDPSVVAEGVDELALGHVGAAFDADLLRFFVQFLFGAVFVVAASAAPAADRGAGRPGRGVGDPSGLLLAGPL